MIARASILVLAGALTGFAIELSRTDGRRAFARAPAALACDGQSNVVELPPSDAATWCANGDVLVVDVRAKDAFERGHIPEALHLPCNREELDREIFARLDAVRMVLVYGADSGSARPVAEALAARGYTSRVLAGGYPAWEATGHACASGPCALCQDPSHAH